ncbi:MAG: ATP-binding cassette domain-containing protein [Myxococcales bacterium]|nr:ATP-binding cassette domain-containing protein [Myxococcales bacterium]MCB9530898.1 ATP-binding cassette domain-containing protein [Myxococcales bacterium]
MIEIRSLSRKYGATVAVDSVSLSIGDGQIVGLLGHNGAGKTTMMKMMTGFLEPTAGTVTVDGVDVTSDRRAAQRLIGYLPENAPLYPEMLVQEYLATMAELRGVAPGDVQRAVVDAATDTGLLDRLVQPIGTLSKGYRQRVGLAQAIVHRPKVLILDEPTNGLDPTQIRSIRELILRLGQKTTIFLSTHILQEIEAVCARVVVLIGGKLAADATLAELTDGGWVRVSVAGAAGVEGVFGGIAGVRSVTLVGPDPRSADHTVYRVECATPAPVGELARVALDRGWKLGGIAPEAKTLEAVFKELEHAHVAAEAAE